MRTQASGATLASASTPPTAPRVSAPKSAPAVPTSTLKSLSTALTISPRVLTLPLLSLMPMMFGWRESRAVRPTLTLMLVNLVTL